ncbi:MAG: cob(I)yrinic acid a,c-diamide adenosyltransferase [Oxalobacter sp.]|nr:MAG: cob(I)yrinic acid a,c-diamide adenosyltransferase [Oxalobacter sp.]
MANRLTAIVTRTGDDGSTGLGDGSRIGKESARVQAIGDIDELNAFIGLLCCELLPKKMLDELPGIQNDLFDLGGELSVPGFEKIKIEHLNKIDASLQNFLSQLPPLKEFVLPGGTRGAALAHVCRTVCRRAERSLVALGKEENVNLVSQQYLNRLSDLFFVYAREINRQAEKEEVFWESMRD